jgi:two-component system LytT family sensor kinase
MLLIPFVENAFKHGTGIILAPEIQIRLEYKDNSLLFRVKNKYLPNNGGSKDNSGGIGLANVQRRLNLLYPDRHLLDIHIADGWYTATLNIDLP